MDKCLACDWDFNEHSTDRASGEQGEYFCKWCTDNSKEDMISKLALNLTESENMPQDVAALEAAQRLNKLNMEWK